MLSVRFALAFYVGIELYHLQGKLSQMACPILYIVHLHFYFSLVLSILSLIIPCIFTCTFQQMLCLHLLTCFLLKQTAKLQLLLSQTLNLVWTEFISVLCRRAAVSFTPCQFLFLYVLLQIYYFTASCGYNNLTDLSPSLDTGTGCVCCHLAKISLNYSVCRVRICGVPHPHQYRLMQS